MSHPNTIPYDRLLRSKQFAPFILIAQRRIYLFLPYDDINSLTHFHFPQLTSVPFYLPQHTWGPKIAMYTSSSFMYVYN